MLSLPNTKSAPKRLTDLRIRNIKPNKAKHLEIPDPQQPGLYLNVQRSWHRAGAAW